MDKSPVIEFKNFGFKYFAQMEPTLYDIDLTINRGEKVVIVGPSGSGKSTIGHCINGLIPFSLKGEISGSLKVCGEETKNCDIFSLSKHVGTVLQDSDGQFVGLSVGEDIAFALENDLVPVDEMRETVKRVADIVDMGGHLKSSPHELSGGQKQRVSFAGVMVDDVDILLFDEPLANLDPATGKTAIALIDDVILFLVHMHTVRCVGQPRAAQNRLSILMNIRPDVHKRRQTVRNHPHTQLHILLLHLCRSGCCLPQKIRFRSTICDLFVLVNTRLYPIVFLYIEIHRKFYSHLSFCAIQTNSVSFRTRYSTLMSHFIVRYAQYQIFSIILFSSLSRKWKDFHIALTINGTVISSAVSPE